jgi:hypothetical protein
VTVIYQPTNGAADTAILRIHDVMSTDPMGLGQARRELTGFGVQPATIVGVPATVGAANFGTVYIGGR